MLIDRSMHGHPEALWPGTYWKGTQGMIGTAVEGEGLGQRCNHSWAWQVVQESGAG